MDLVIHALVGLLPVCAFLGALVFLDSYKLVPMRWILGTIAIGSVAGLLSYPFNVGTAELLDLDFMTLTRYAAPVIEEALKALIIVALIRFNRIGFPVDAAIYGFAVGCRLCNLRKSLLPAGRA